MKYRKETGDRMKKTTLLNSQISSVIAEMGHTQTLTIGDAGLPVPFGTDRIDLALVKGIPSFLDVLDAVLTELCVERIVLAEEIRTVNPEMEAEILKRFPGIQVDYVPHEEFKEQTEDSMAVIRTGETRSYSNVILVSGVTF